MAINKAMRNADSLATLGEVWKLKQAEIRALPANWQQELADEKDRLKVQLLGMSRGVTA